MRAALVVRLRDRGRTAVRAKIARSYRRSLLGNFALSAETAKDLCTAILVENPLNRSAILEPGSEIRV